MGCCDDWCVTATGRGIVGRRIRAVRLLTIVFALFSTSFDSFAGSSLYSFTSLLHFASFDSNFCSLSDFVELFLKECLILLIFRMFYLLPS